MNTWYNFHFIYIFGKCDIREMHMILTLSEHWLLLDNDMCMCECQVVFMSYYDDYCNNGHTGESV